MLSSYAAAAGKLVTRFVYALSDPEQPIVRYIGQTNDPMFRLFNHVSGSERESEIHVPICLSVHDWIAYLAILGRIPTLNILEILPHATKADAVIREKFWLQRAFDDGYCIVNQVVPLELHGRRKETLSKCPYTEDVQSRYDLVNATSRLWRSTTTKAFNAKGIERPKEFFHQRSLLKSGTIPFKTETASEQCAKQIMSQVGYERAIEIAHWILKTGGESI